MKIQLIVFDLDDTLLDTTRLLIPIARTPAFEARILQPLPLMEGAKENLDYLWEKYNLVVLTQGRPDAQKKKIQSMNIESFFKKIYIADPSINETKAQFFQKILDESGLDPRNILSIGNRRYTDIREAKKLGMNTCLFHYGEHADEKVAQNEDHPDFTVINHKELIAKCQL